MYEWKCSYVTNCMEYFPKVLESTLTCLINGHATNRVSWKLRSLAKIWYPIEVAEVEIAASGGRRSGQVPGNKKLIKNSEIRNFWATQTLYTSKESWEQSSFRFEIKLEDYVMKKLKK